MSVFVSFLLIVGAARGASGPTGDTGHTGGGGGDADTDADSDSDTDTDADTDTGQALTGDTAPFCFDCGGAADIAGDEGGNPCDQGCSSSGATPAGWAAVSGFALLRRRRARRQSRSYST